MGPRRVLVIALLSGALLGALAACESAPPPPPPTRRDAGPCELIPEVCNGEDDDCNGLVDDVGDVELCDGIDQDCDGTFDEGAECTGFEAPGPTGWVVGPTSTGVLVTDDGALTLEPPRVDIVQPSLWIANSDEGTVSRLDPMTGHEVGRYPSVGAGSGLPTEGNAPSRTALDQRLDAYVANRAFEGQASVTKIAGDLARCVDRDLDGMVETSTDLDGSGTIELDPSLGEYLGVDDECILWNVPVGRSADAIARALAIGLAGPDGEPGDVWVGLFNEQRAMLLSRTDGHEIASVDIGLTPYGAVAGVDGRVWLTAGPTASSGLVAVDAETFAIERVSYPSTGLRSYGISVDGMGRIVLAARGGGWRGVIAYDPGEERWTQGPSFEGDGMLRGIAASADAVWVAGPVGTTGTLFELSVTDLSIRATHSLSAGDVVGVGVAFDGRIWGIARDQSLAFRLEPDSGVVESFPTGRGPYTYSDFTGFGLNGILGSTGLHRVTVEGCESAVWTSIRVDADVPADTSVQVRVRAAETVTALAAASWIGPFEPLAMASLTEPPGPVPAGRFLEISLRLWSSTPGVVPRVFGVSTSARCDDVR